MNYNGYFLLFFVILCYFFFKGGHDYVITALILSGENVVSSGWDEKLVLWNIPSKKIEVEMPCER